MYIKKFPSVTTILVGAGFFLFADQFLKWVARSNPEFEYHIFGKWLGWEYMANSGIAFSLPFPNWLLVLITPLIIFGLIIWAIKHAPHSMEHGTWNMEHVSFALIISGAISNFIDRVLFSATIDYLRIFTGVINLADVMIVIGAGMIVWDSLLFVTKK